MQKDDSIDTKASTSRFQAAGLKTRGEKLRGFRPFGRGVRKCWGQTLAEEVVAQAAAALLSSFEFASARDGAGGGGGAGSDGGAPATTVHGVHVVFDHAPLDRIVVTPVAAAAPILPPTPLS